MARGVSIWKQHPTVAFCEETETNTVLLFFGQKGAKKVMLLHTIFLNIDSIIKIIFHQQPWSNLFQISSTIRHCIPQKSFKPFFASMSNGNFYIWLSWIRHKLCIIQVELFKPFISSDWISLPLEWTIFLTIPTILGMWPSQTDQLNETKEKD